jgi:hypothetical protein
MRSEKTPVGGIGAAGRDCFGIVQAMSNRISQLVCRAKLRQTCEHMSIYLDTLLRSHRLKSLVLFQNRSKPRFAVPFKIISQLAIIFAERQEPFIGRRLGN